jgi:FAD:protein FMN transferase
MERKADSTIERAQPWLGTFVSVRVGGLSDREAGEAIDAAFAEVSGVHGLMSFHDDASELSLLNREAAVRRVRVHPYTYDVLTQARAMAEATDGTFDITTGFELVEWQLLPRSDNAATPGGCWKDVELHGDGWVRFRRPLTIDLGGIAKGYAVDRAIERLLHFKPVSAVVNAGGDLRVTGEAAERVGLYFEGIERTRSAPVLELQNGSLASSSGHLSRKLFQGTTVGPHVDGQKREPASSRRFVSVVAASCVTADALTKVVMARGAGARAALEQFDAQAYVHDPGEGWTILGNTVKSESLNPESNWQRRLDE